MPSLNNHRQTTEVFTLVKSILLVDQDPFVTEILKQNITKAGHAFMGSVSSFKDLESAVAEDNIDAILINLEVKGDFDAVQAAKLIKIEYDIPFYFICLKSSPDSIAWATEINPDGFLHLAGREDQLNLQLKELLR